MTFAEMLRGSPLNQQRMADDNAMNLAGMLARGRAGTVRQEPSLMQKIGGVIADYAVPDRLDKSPNPSFIGTPLNDSVMNPKLDFSKLESLRGTPVDMADAPDPVPMLIDMMPMAGITAFHGSPHKFNKFDMGKIGTGEGSQSHGRGLYLSENPKVAKGYANDLGKSMVDGREPNYADSIDHATVLAGEKGSREKGLESAKYHLDWLNKISEKGLGTNKEGIGRNIQEYKDAIGILEGDTPLRKLSHSGQMYKVDIPDDQIAKMLDWDKPLSGQGEEVLRLADEYGVAHTADGGALAQMMGGNHELKGVGIPGIKYLDGDSRSGGKGTSNFVLFADEIAKILERNGQPIGDLAEGLQRK